MNTGKKKAGEQSHAYNICSFCVNLQALKQSSQFADLVIVLNILFSWNSRVKSHEIAKCSDVQ